MTHDKITESCTKTVNIFTTLHGTRSGQIFRIFINLILSFKRNKKKKQDGELATKTKGNGFQCTKLSSYVEEMEVEHGVLSDCSDERKVRRRKLQCVPVPNW